MLLSVESTEKRFFFMSCDAGNVIHLRDFYLLLIYTPLQSLLCVGATTLLSVNKPGRATAGKGGNFKANGCLLHFSCIVNG
jgi:hypothetical protein